jgi:hypothetical protein
MTEQALYCANHPNQETALRCNRCEKPICTRCAVLTPVGYRCRECVRGQQSVFESARVYDFLIAGVVAALGVAVGVGLLSFIGFWGLLLAPLVGGGLAEVVRWAVRRRRSRKMGVTIIAGGVLGLAPHLTPALLTLTLAAGGGLDAGAVGRLALSAIWPILQGGLVISALYARTRGIHL